MATVAGWNLMNEPRVEHGWPASAPELQAWIGEMAAYAKRMARYQLVTVGGEGMYQPSNCQSKRCVPFCPYQAMQGYFSRRRALCCCNQHFSALVQRLTDGTLQRNISRC